MTEVSATGTVEQALAHATRLLDSDPALAAEQLTEILKVVEAHPAALRLLAEPDRGPWIQSAAG